MPESGADTSGRTGDAGTRAAPAIGAAAAAAAEFARRSHAPTASAQLAALARVHHARTSGCRRRRRRVVRAAPARARARSSARSHSLADAHARARRRAAAAAGAGGHGPALDRGADVLAAHRASTGVHAARRARGGVRRPRRAAHRRPGRERLARARAPQHLLSAVAARRSSAGRTSAIGCRRHARAFTICCGCRGARVSVSTFTLEDDAIVAPSPFLEELDGVRPADRAACRCRRRRARLRCTKRCRIEPLVAVGASTGDAAEWLALRASRTPRSTTRLPRRGRAARSRRSTRSAMSSATSSVRSSTSPRYVLGLDEERDEESGLTPQERGQFLHEVFEAFFAAWQARGGRRDHRRRTSPTRSRCSTRWPRRSCRAAGGGPRARADLPARLGRRAGLAERAFAFEIEQGVGGRRAAARARARRAVRVRRRGRAAARRDSAARPIASTCSADGTLRVVDYKLGRAPKPARALQLPVYGVCAQQALEGRHGRSWTLARAGYVAFREKNAFVALGAVGRRSTQALRGRAAAIARAVDGIERGEFPPSPTSRSSARAAATPASAGRTTSATSDARSPTRVSVVAARRCSSRRPGRPAPRSRRQRAATRDAFGREPIADADAARELRRRSRATTSCSRRRPAPARRACSSRATSTCSRRASIRPTSSRSRSRARRRPRCASASSRELRQRGRAVGVRSRRAGASSAIGSATSRSAPSTRSACRCCASSRSRPTSIPASTWPTRPKCRGSSTSRSIGRCASVAASRASDADVALVLAQLGDRADARRAGRAARAAARRVGRARSVPRARARRISTADVVCRRAGDGAAGRAANACPAGSTRFLADGPSGHPRFQLLARELARSRRTSSARGDAAIRARARPGRGALPDRRRASRGRAARSIRTTRRRTTRRRTRRSGIAPAVFADRAARRASRVARSAAISTSCWRAASGGCSRSRSTQYRAGARRAIACSISPTCCSGRSSCCGRWTSSRRAASGSSRATTTCSSTSSRTPAARSGSWSRCSSRRGAKGSALADAARRSSSSATASSRSTASATPKSRCCRRPARYIEALRPDGRRAPVDHAQLPRGAGAARVRQRRVRARCRSPTARPDDVHLRRSAIGFPVDPSATTAVRGPVLGLAVADDPDELRRRGGRRDRADPARGHRARPADRRARARPRPGDIGSCSGRARATASSSARSSVAASRPTSTRASGSSTPTRSRTSSALLRYLARSGVGPARRGVPALALRPAVGSRRWRALAPELAAALIGREPPPTLAQLDDEDRRVLDQRARARRRAGSRWSIACRRRSARADPRRDRVRLRAARAAPAAGVGEPEEDARPRPAHPESRLRDARRASPITSTRSPPATNRTPSSRRSTP